MRVIQTPIPDVLLLEPKVFEDARGFFFESYNAQALAAATGVQAVFVQDNHSYSRRDVIRGLHYQVNRPQGKLVRAATGSIFDVAVDLRRSSPTFGKSVIYELSAENRWMLWIPPGFAHGFVTISPSADVLYKTTDYYSPADERTIRWDDPDLQIAWPVSGPPILSAKDLGGVPLRGAEVFP